MTKSIYKNFNRKKIKSKKSTNSKKIRKNFTKYLN